MKPLTKNNRHFYLLIVYRYLKTVIVMAKFDLKFISFDNENWTISVKQQGKEISIIISDETECMNIYLDKSTAIKFAKTLRTEINKITESEV